MRKVLFLALMIAAILTIAGSRPVAGCTDWDEDGVCGNVDCNDYNPTVGYNSDDDGDGVSICQGDCDDGDAANVDKCMGSILRMYPVYYQPPEQPCLTGYTVHTKVYYCWIDIYGTKTCATTPYWEYDTDYYSECFFG